MKRFIIPLATVGLLASGLASAQEWVNPWDGKFWGYIGANAGQSKFKGSCSTFFDCDRKDSAWNLHLGGNFNHLIGVELGYTDFGRMRTFGGDTEAQALDVSLTLGAPIGPHFAVFAKGGAAYSDTDVSASPASFVSTGSKKDWGTKWGAGATWAFSRNLQARVDWDRYKLEFASGDRDIDLLSAGLQFRF
jgi:opacity protein-like surface antigen